MTFQLVRATDTEIAIWHTEHGHIYAYAVTSDGDGLEQRLMRGAPDSTEPPELFAEAALQFAMIEAQARKLIGRAHKSGRTNRRYPPAFPSGGD